MHVAVCSLLSRRGYYKYAGRDEDGWPHFEMAQELPGGGLMQQERVLKECVIEYFDV